jgi:short-subunit dehydrogenase
MRKVILISGGSDGLGKALATRLSPHHMVVIFSQDKEKVSLTAKEILCDFEVGDVSNSVDVKRIVASVIKKYKRIDCLVNNAGIWIQGPIEDNDSELIKKTMEVNATGTMLLTSVVVPYLKSQGSGRIINVISQAGLYPKAERSVYTASKWAITGFTKSLQLELGDSNIAVSGFYPGPMKTGLFKKAGIDKDMKNYMDLDEPVSVLENLINMKDGINVPEIGLRATTDQLKPKK